MIRKIILVFCVAAAVVSCDQPDKKNVRVATTEGSRYLNHSDSARYVGMDACRSCHESIYSTFIKTGMGQSFARASRSKSAADFKEAHLYDRFSDLHYKATWSDDSLFFTEYRLASRDTVHRRSENVSFIIGSGQHTNSHIHNENGYLTQMPMTYYTQKKKWDLPPGFENGVNTRFTRKIGLECMTCHNAYPDLVMGSENKFRSVPEGIDCERCHGPGSIHIEQRQSSERIDTSRYIDYSIVNPAKLSIEAQFDICQRCHLQGNAVLKEGASFYDFKPGKKLSDFISVFAPRYSGAADEFIMASHAERLKMSPCFISSLERSKNKNALKPYKDAMTCVTCHNPHVSVKATDNSVFNRACMNCHSDNKKVSTGAEQLSNAHTAFKGGWDNCVKCHMPQSGSTDIPHVSVHDHFIRKPVSKGQKEKIRQFLGLYSVNDRSSDAGVKAQAYLDQYEKFEQKSFYLDSAEGLLKGIEKKALRTVIQLHFVRQDYRGVIDLVRSIGENECRERILIRKSYDNRDAWTSYRIAESYYASGLKKEAVSWFSKAAELAPFNLEFRNKLGTCYAEVGELGSAEEEFSFILRENPKFAAVYANMGYVQMLKGSTSEALRLYKIGISLDPDNEVLLLNLAGYYLFTGDKRKAENYLDSVLRLNPGNQKALEAKRRIRH